VTGPRGVSSTACSAGPGAAAWTSTAAQLEQLARAVGHAAQRERAQAQPAVGHRVRGVAALPLDEGGQRAAAGGHAVVGHEDLPGRGPSGVSRPARHGVAGLQAQRDERPALHVQAAPCAPRRG
jgi:hypothetical protein